MAVDVLSISNIWCSSTVLKLHTVIILITVMVCDALFDLKATFIK